MANGYKIKDGVKVFIIFKIDKIYKKKNYKKTGK